MTSDDDSTESAPTRRSWPRSACGLLRCYIGGESLKTGLQLTDAVVPMGSPSPLVAIGIWRFNQRDLAT
jgi:hypothetical protein